MDTLMLAISSEMRAKWTLEDYHQMVDAGVLDERRVELVAGEIVEMAPEGEVHAYCSEEADDYLSSLLGERAQVRQAKPITLVDLNSEPEPDIAVVKRLGRQYRQHHPYPDDIFWVMEFSDSSLQKDMGVKSRLYAAAGIPEYWVVNVKTMEVTVWRSPSADGYQSEQGFKSGTIYPVAFPEVAIDVVQLLGNSDNNLELPRTS